jgi:hypothetical protein
MAIISKQKIVRQPGFLYYVKDGYVMAAPMQGNLTGKKHKVNEEKINSAGKRCWINKQGYVETK